MSGFWKRGMGIVAVLALVGCGGPVTEDDVLLEKEQALQRCGANEPPCPNGWYCQITAGNTRGVCRIEPVN